MVIALAVLAGLLVGGWFGTANLRTDRAITFDGQSKAALASGDTAAAYRDARFAYALAPRRQRALDLGALAYLRKDYPAAGRYFRSAEGGDSGTVTESLVGQAAAAAQAGDQGAFDRANRIAGRRPSSQGVRLALASAALNDGNLARAADLLGSDQPATQNVAFTKAAGQAGQNAAAAKQTVADAGSAYAQPEFTDPVYGAFVKELISVPKGATAKLAAALERMSGVESKATRTVTLANALYGLGDYRAAERLARSAVQSQPDYRDGWNVLAAAQTGLRDFDGAEQSLKISSNLDPSNGYTWYLRAQVANLRGQHSQAEEYRQRASLLGYQAK